VWPGECSFPDFTMPETRSWWATLYQDFMATGIDGVWNDMNEPAVFNGPGGTMPDDNRHRGGGELPPDVHLRYHNVYGYLMVQASREGIMQANPEKRPFVLTRANHLGGQRFAATWTGDNISNTEHMELSIPMSLTLGLSGQPFSGPDIGGFVGSPSAELMGQWMALGAFYPFCRNHTSTGTQNQEPWSFGEAVEKASRIALNRRYRLLPYWYTLFREASVSGMPVMRPVFFADPTNLLLREEDEAFLVGGDLLVVPQWADQPALPSGIWRKIYITGAFFQDDPYQPQILQRGGSIIPLAQPMQSTAQFQPDSVTLLVSPDEEKLATGILYADAGEGWGYLDGDYMISGFEAIPVAPDTLLLTCNSLEGEWDVSNRKYRVGVVTNYDVFYSDWTSDTLIKLWLPPEISVELVSPQDGTNYPEGSQVDLIAEVESEVTLDKVEFYRDDVLIGEVMEAPYEMSYIPEPGSYFIQAVAVSDTLKVYSNKAHILVGEFGDGSILSQLWFNIPGVYVDDLTDDPAYPTEPDENNQLDAFASPQNIGSNYGRRVIGYVYPPKSGYYTFWISGDDYCELWLSTDSSWAGRQLIAEVPGWTLPGEWAKYPEQESEVVSLAAGEKYFIMALQKEAEGDDFVEVAWTPPDGEREIIEGLFLSPYDPSSAGVDNSMAETDLQIYPNPASDFVFIRTGHREGEVGLYDLKGQIILSKKVNKGKSIIKLQLDALEPGVYLLEWKNRKTRAFEKLVLQ